MPRGPQSGGAYLILELAYPPPLLHDVIADAGPRVVLTQERYAQNLREDTARLCMDEGGKRRSRPGERGSALRWSGEPGLRVVLVGDHGQAEGHRELSQGGGSLVPVALRAQRLRSGDRVGCNVFFIWEMLRPLLRGATTVVIPDDVIYDPGALIRFMEEYGISETLITPSLLETVLDASGPDLAERLSSLRVLWLNGEVVTRTLARRALSLLPETRVLNVYSCSETHEVAAGDLRELAESPHSTYCPVGRPMDPDRLYILDDEVSKVPEGGTGELFVGGDCLARGYVNLPEKTEESFPADPFSPVDGARMYRTGDRADPARRQPRDPGPHGLHGEDPGLQRRAGSGGGRDRGQPRGQGLRRGRRWGRGRGQAPRRLSGPRFRRRARRALRRMEPRPEDGTKLGDPAPLAGQPPALRHTRDLRGGRGAPAARCLRQGGPPAAARAPRARYQRPRAG